MTAPGPVLLYDGSCGFCQQSVQFVLRHERQTTLRFAPLRGALGGAIRVRHPELVNADSVVWWEPGTDSTPEQVLTKSAAALRVVRYLGGWWSLLSVGWVVPRAVRDVVYDFIARHRHRLAAPDDSCMLPTPDTRSRFLLDGDDG